MMFGVSGRGDDGMLGLFANRICGSADIYAKSGKGPRAASTLSPAMMDSR